MTELLSLYTNLFVITITIIGILVASIIALSQLLEPLLVSKSAQKLVRPAILIIAVIFLVLSALLSLPGMVLLSVKTHNYISWHNFGVDIILANQWYVFGAIVALIVSAILVIIFIYSVSRLLVPANALDYIKKMVKTNTIIDYFTKDGTTAPFPPVYFASFFNKEERESDPEKEEVERKESQKKYEAALKKYDADKLKLSKKDNPLFPLETYLIRAIQRSNLTIVAKTLKTLEEMITGLASNKDFKGLGALIEYYVKLLENAQEIAEASGLRSVSLELIESSSRIGDMLVEKKRFNELLAMETYWRTRASEALNSSPAIFKRSVGILGEIGRSILKNDKYKWDDIRDLSDNIMRGLGWLGERLLDSGAPEKRELMLNDNETQYGALINAVSNIGWEMDSHRANEYPLIYFDCLYVIAKKLAPYCSDEDEYDGDNGNSIFSLMYGLHTFGEAAIRAGNVNGASLALLRLEDHCKIARDTNSEKHMQYTLETIFRLGGEAAAVGMKGAADFIRRRGQNLDDVAIDLLVKYKGTHDLDHEAHEVFIKTGMGGDYKKVKAYLKKASDAFKGNFGMNLSDDDDDA